jgi:hypothetical protein
MRSTLVEGRVRPKNAPGMLFVPHDEVVEAVPAERADHPLAIGVRFGRAEGRGEKSGPQPTNTPAELGAVDRVPVVDEEPRALTAIGGRLHEALCGPLRAGIRGDARLDDLASLQTVLCGL